MKHSAWDKINSLAVKQIGKWSVYINNGADDERVWEIVREDVTKRYPAYLEILSYLVNGGMFSFNTEQDAWEFYKIFIQHGVESSALYATIYDASGECISENT